MFGGVLAASATLLVAGCGGGAKQTAGEPARTYKIEVLDKTFKPEQAIGRPAKMRIELRNAGAKTVPNIAVTLDSFYYTDKYPELASTQRPVWVVEKGPGAPPQAPVQSQAVSPPGGGQTTYVNTWALGALAPHHAQVFEWTVVPVKPGTHSVDVKINAGLGGRAKATLPNGRTLDASFNVKIAPAPPSRHVNPSTGRVELGTFAAQP
jgi:hypothetical protein